MELARALNEITGLRTENQALRANLEAVQFQLAQLQHMVFGHKAERLNIDAQSGLLFEVAPPPAPEPQIREVSVAPKQKPVRACLPAHLPREVEIIDLPEEEKPCPCCGGERHVIGEAVSGKLDYVPATLKVLETRRLKYACRPCEGNLAVAPLPASPIEQGMAAPGLLAHVLVSKFADHLPLNRQEAMLRRAGIELPRSTLCDWVLGAAECLRPLYEHLIGCVRLGDILHSDDTPVPLREKGATVKARAWGWVNPQLRLAAYEFTVSRAGIHPQSFLTGWEGYLIADAYAGYDRLFANPNLREVGCWAHARRKFFDVAKTQKAPGLAHEAVARIATDEVRTPAGQVVYFLKQALSGLATCWRCPVGKTPHKGISLAGQQSVHTVLQDLITILFPGCHGFRSAGGRPAGAEMGRLLKRCARQLTEQIKGARDRYAVGTRGSSGPEPTLLQTEEAIRARSDDLTTRLRDAGLVPELRPGETLPRVEIPLPGYSGREKDLSDLRNQINQLSKERERLIEQMKQKNFDTGSMFLE